MSNEYAQVRARLMYDPEELNYDFGPEHPLQSLRLVALMDLLESSGLWCGSDQQRCLPFRAATIEELGMVHTPNYIEAVQRLSVPGTNDTDELALKYGLGERDTPTKPGIHEVAARIAGGTLVAMSAVMGLPEGGTFASEDDRPLHVFHPAGGWHHALPDQASGFCVYNDAAVAIAHVLRATEAKVLYIDFDAHHGDGVQQAFYDDSRVMTVSFHETGRYLYPGTGDVLELGSGLGRGYSVNVPLEPFTEDDSFIEVINTLLPPLVLSFGPDIIISQHGCDTHAWDPLTHLALTMQGIQAQVQLVHRLAHTYCHGRWVALGGGGYDLYRVVPRAWSIVWAELSEQPLPQEIPREWVARWQPAWLANEELEEAAQEALGKPASSTYFPTTFQDRAEDFPTRPRRWSINHTNRRTVAASRHLLLPPSVRHAFPAAQRQSPLAEMYDLLHLRGSQTPSRSATLETEAGPLLLRDFCPPSLIERLRVDSGLTSFARTLEREHELLLNIAKSPDCALTLAHTPVGEIVGEVTLAPPEGWWEGLENTYEVAIEVSPHWRSMGVAHELLAFALDLEALEDMILFALGLSWHWDTEGLGMTPRRYRKLIADLFGSQGFVEYATADPDISMEPANILLVRIGRHVDQHDAVQFYSRLRNSPNFSCL
jgi:acetoin utilization deacetylase AcuC-like enzyme/GNAT superfamily N-acetyltransferase